MIIYNTTDTAFSYKRGICSVIVPPGEGICEDTYPEEAKALMQYNASINHEGLIVPTRSLKMKTKPGDCYQMLVCGLPRKYRVLSEEEARERRGDEFVNTMRKIEGFIFVYDEYKSLTKAVCEDILMKEGTPCQM